MCGRKVKILAWATATLCLAAVWGSASAARGEIRLLAAEQTIPQDGVLVGVLELTNASDVGTYEPGVDFSVLGGTIIWQVQRPDGAVKEYMATIVPTYFVPEAIRLEPHEFIQRPICLVKQSREYLFHDIGHYRLRAEFRHGASVYSEWVDLEVVQGGSGHEKYLKSHDFYSMIDSFQHESWALTYVDRIEEFGDYKREVAKIVLYNLGGGSIVHNLLRDSSKASAANAEIGLGLAKKYGFGIEIWEHFSDLCSHPEKINKEQGIVHPKNSFYF